MIFETQDRRPYPPNGFLMEDGSNPNIKVGQTGLSKTEEYMPRRQEARI